MFNEITEKERKQVARWEAGLNERAGKCRAAMTKYLKQEYDGVILSADRGSFNRVVKSYIVFDTSQILIVK